MGDLASIPGLGRSPGGGKGYPLQYSGLENSMDWIVHGVTKSWTRLSDFHIKKQKTVYFFAVLLKDILRFTGNISSVPLMNNLLKPLTTFPCRNYIFFFSPPFSLLPRWMPSLHCRCNLCQPRSEKGERLRWRWLEEMPRAKDVPNHQSISSPFAFKTGTWFLFSSTYFIKYC